MTALGDRTFQPLPADEKTKAQENLGSQVWVINAE